MMNMIPTQATAARGLLLAALVLVVLAGAAGAGAAVNGWRLDAAHAEELAVRDKAYGALDDKLREQNHAVDVLGLRTKAAEDRQKLAEQMSARVIDRIDDQAAAIAASRAPDCKGVLQGAWGLK